MLQTSTYRWHFWIGVVVLALALLSACKHEPALLPGGGNGGGDTTTTGGGDTTGSGGGDTTGSGGGDTTIVTHPCDPDSVYFERDVLPIIVSNCAKSGCHDAASQQDGVILDNYQNIISTGKIKAFDPNDSELYEKITETDPDDIMPPPPDAPLTAEQIALIRKWIQQGAQDLSCEDSVGCDTTNMSFATDVQPILTTYCVGCHSGSNPGGGIDLASHSGVKGAAQTGRLYGAISHQSGFVAMPQGGNKLPDCELNTIKAWIDQGALDN